jgi:Fur family transcriptional regulator, peroxide stress response regulator
MSATSTVPSPSFAQALAESGLRSTPQREVIYSILLSERNHPTADEVFARVKSELPSISLATVYNCLETLVQCKLVKAVNFERESTRYCPNLQPHAHFHDDQTGATHDISLPADLLGQIKSILPPGYDASSVEITFRGKSVAANTGDQRN